MRGKLMRLWTRAEHQQILSDNADDTNAAAEYSASGRAKVSPQLVRYWRTIFLKHEGKLAPADRELRDLRKFVQPSPDDDIGDLNHVPEVAERILVIGDLHAPYHHPDTIEFLVSVRNSFRPDLVVQIGDELDYHAMSFHESDPNLDAAGPELERGKLFLSELHREFPQMLLVHSNHGSMTYRRAKHSGIPVQMLRRYRDVAFPDHGAPGWSWAFGWRIRTRLGIVLFKHQTPSAVSNAAHEGCSVVVGHQHGQFGVDWAASSSRLYYGANTGCLIDKDALAFAYGKNSQNKPIIGCLMIVDGMPTPIPMVLDDTGRWVHRTKGN